MVLENGVRRVQTGLEPLPQAAESGGIHQVMNKFTHTLYSSSAVRFQYVLVCHLMFLSNIPPSM